MDRVGLGWRPELAAGIFTHRESIDLVELIVDDFLKSSAQKLRPLKTLSKHIPMICHGVSLGLASSHPVKQKRLDQLARVLNIIQPEKWSEHLSFVRAGGNEIGHLAAPPRTEAVIEGTLRNLSAIRAAVGELPALENIATLIDPPGSQMSEGEWTQEILAASSADLLLDLHNLYANAVNFGHDPFDYLDLFPLHRARTIHLSGGHWIREPVGFEKNVRGRRLLDDHIHDVPPIVFALLSEVAHRTAHPLTVIIERDGHYPPFEILLEQIKMARQAISTGRALRSGQTPDIWGAT